MPNPIILYDGVCGLCNRFVQFVLKRDRKDIFRFAALQSSFAARILQRHEINPQILDTVYLVLDHNQPGERLLAREDASAAGLDRLGGIWRLWACLSRYAPKRFRDWRYDLLAKNRYRVFGRFQTCPLPTQQDCHNFLVVIDFRDAEV